MTIQARQAAHRLGHVAEWRAVWRLRLAGYSVLAHLEDLVSRGIVATDGDPVIGGSYRMA